MANVPLRDVPLQPQFRGQARAAGGFYVFYPGTTTQATVYGDAAGSVTLVQPIPYSDYTGQQGFVVSGEYTLSANSFLQNVEATAGDNSTSASNPLVDSSLAAMNFQPILRNSVAATATSQLVRLVRVTPSTKIVVAKIVTVSGSTAVA